MSFFGKLFGKREQPQMPTQPPLQDQITPEFAEMLDNTAFYLKSFDEINRGWGIGQQETFSLKQDEGILRFHFADGKVVECNAQAVGSFNTTSNTWFWAWANPSINDNLKVDAQRTYEYGKEHQIALLTTQEWPADIEWSWRMTAFVAGGRRAEGAFCATMGPMRMFFTFRDVNIIPPPENPS